MRTPPILPLAWVFRSDGCVDSASGSTCPLVSRLCRLRTVACLSSCGPSQHAGLTHGRAGRPKRAALCVIVLLRWRWCRAMSSRPTNDLEWSSPRHGDRGSRAGAVTVVADACPSGASPSVASTNAHQRRPLIAGPQGAAKGSGAAQARPLWRVRCCVAKTYGWHSRGMLGRVPR